MMEVCMIHKSSLGVVVMINCTSITFNSTNNTYTIHGAYATTPTTVQDVSVNANDFLVRIMES